MASLASSVRLSFVGLGAVVAVLPLSSGACGRTACFEYSPSEYAATHGCPSQSSALQNFTSPTCPGAVLSVDSAGTYEDGELCCYSVTQQDIDLVGAGGSCPGFGGSGGSGGTGATGAFGGDTTGFGGFGVSEVSSVSGIGGTVPFGGAGGAGGFGQTTSSSGMPSCTTCDGEFLSAGADPNDLCPSAAPSWDALTSCACTGVCSAPCTVSFCAGMPPDMVCMPCLTDTSTSGCGAALAACQSN
jgi:hypothetical protein